MSTTNPAELCQPGECPRCKQPRLTEAPGGLFHHCFGCGQDVRKVERTDADAIAGEIIRVSKAHLRNSNDHQASGVHPQVLVDANIGIVPPDLDVLAITRPVIAEAVQARDQLLAMPRGRGRPSKEEQKAINWAVSRVERLQKLEGSLTDFIERHRGDVVCGYVDHTQHAFTRLVVPARDGRSGDEFSCSNGFGTFGSEVFAAGPEEPRSLEGLQQRVIVVPSEFDFLQLQSLGARLAEEEGMRPEAGYFKTVAVGPTTVDAKGVRSLGRMPLVIQNGADRDQGHGMVEAIRQERNLFTAKVSEGVLADLLRMAPMPWGDGTPTTTS